MGVCKTGAKKSSPDLSNFYVVLAGHDKFADTARATTCKCNFKVELIKKKSTKKSTFGKHGFKRENNLKTSDKKIKNISSFNEATSKNSRPPNAATDD